ncbi:MAG: cobalamin-binding protein [Gemmatimonadota bacterium]|nr:cobalamin-binding protein [Gemmatimonadota bacterium]
MTHRARRAVRAPCGWSLLALVWLAVGCTVDSSAAAGSRTAGAGDVPADSFVVDGRGKRLSTGTPRERVVSLVPSLTEIIVELGGASQLVGRTRFDEDPRIAEVPSVGGTVSPDVEAILDSRPDLVVTWSDADARSLSERFESFDLPVYAARARSIADFDRHAAALGALLGRSGQADDLVARVHERFDDLRVEVPEEARPKVLFVVWPQPLITTGRDTFVDELIRLVGGRGAFDDLADPWPTVSFEAVLERDPDLVIVSSEHAEGLVPDWIEEDPFWRTLDAVREGHVHLVDADVFNRPGPGMVDAAEELAGYVRAVRRERENP